MVISSLLAFLVVGMAVELSTAVPVDDTDDTTTCKNSFVVNLYHACSSGHDSLATDGGKRELSGARSFFRRSTGGISGFWRRNIANAGLTNENEKRGNNRFWRSVQGENGESYSGSHTVYLENVLTSCLVHIVKDTTMPQQLATLDPSTPIDEHDLISLKEIFADDNSPISMMAEYCCRHGCSTYLLKKLYSI